jgi:hypothetical protein
LVSTTEVGPGLSISKAKEKAKWQQKQPR